MSQITQYQDDFSGEIVTADSIYPDFRISIGTEKYTLDATPETVLAIRNALAPFTGKARMMPGSKPIRPLGEADEIPASTNANGNGHQHVTIVPPSNEVIRKWAESTPDWAAKANARGSSFQAVKDAYAAAH